MSSWQIEPGEVQNVLEGLEPHVTSLSTVLSDEDLESLPENLASGQPVTVKVTVAVQALLTDQQDELQTISNHVTAGMNGVVNATRAYIMGQEEQAARFQRAMAEAAESGDMSYFDKHGYQDS